MKFRYLLFLLLSLTLVNCSKDDEAEKIEELSSENKILTFGITTNNSTFNGIINHTTKTITLETNSLESSISIVPQISIPPNASISPSVSTPQNFNNNVSYTVTAENGDMATYTVISNNVPISSEKKILSFQFDFGGNIVDGIIDHTNLVVELGTIEDVSSVVPIVTVSEYAVITPSTSIAYDFTAPKNFTVTAQDGSSNVYVVNVKKQIILTVDGGRYFTKATIEVNTQNIDLTIPNSKMVLDNGINSYDLTYSNYLTYSIGDVDYSNFSLYLTNNIDTASDYKLKYVVDNQVKVESDFLIDVVGESVPTIISANQSLYNYGDTLILTGTNLLPGLRVYAQNGSIYQYSTSDISVNSAGTILTFPMNTTNQSMFPSYSANSTFSTPVVIYSSGRKGEGINVDFY